MSNKIETRGKTVKEAVSEALLQMGARRDEVEVTVLEEPKSGFLGILGNRQAKVLVEKKARRRGRGRGSRQDADRNEITHDLGSGSGGSRRGRGSRGGRGRGGSQRENAETANRKPEQNARREDRPDRENRQDGENREGREGRSRRGRRGGRGRGRGGRKDQNAQNDPNQQNVQNEQNAQGGQSSQGARNDQRNPGSASEEKREERGGRSRRSRSRRTRRPENERPVAAQVAEDADLQPVETEQVDAQGGESREKEESESSRGRSRRGRGSRGGRRSRSRRTRDESGEMSARNNDHAEINGNVAPDQPRDEEPRRGRGRSRRRDENAGRNNAPAENAEPDTMIATGLKATNYAQPVREVGEDAIDETLVAFTTGMLIRAGFPCRCEVKEDEYRQVRVITGDDSAGMLIGRHGSTVDAVEHLVDRMMGVAAGDRVKMNLDINNYRRRREDTLGERVAEAVERVRETERDYHVEPMCARERRLVHLAAEEYEGIRTYTLMRSGDKHVVIALDRGDDSEGDGSIEPQAESEVRDVDVAESATEDSVAVNDAAAETEESDDVEVEIVEMEPVDEDLMVDTGSEDEEEDPENRV